MFWSVPVIIIPLLGFFINLLISSRVARPLGAIFAVSPVLIPFCWLLFLLMTQGFPQPYIYEHWYYWLNVSNVSIAVAFYWDNLSVLMSLIILGIGSLIHVYSVGYMSAEKNSGRFFSYLNLFIFFMLLLVLGSNMLVSFVGWEGVGLCSYLLIGYYYDQLDASLAAPKAFIMNRIGDWGYLLAMLLVITWFGNAEYAQISADLSGGFAAGTISLLFINVFCLLLFLACTGKSAQFPLYTWLPDAMAGPTPVSALIHAATMVTAGVYLITRLASLFLISELVNSIILYTAAITALITALIALRQWDIKKVLAYSTVSQLGFMFMALAVQDYNSAMFHLTTHAFFKALLFLAAGAVILQLDHQQDMRYYGGLNNRLKFMLFIFIIGAWAISGLPLGAGFFSKDEILISLYDNNRFIWGIALLTSLLTSIYIFRLLFLTFYNKVNNKLPIAKLPFTMWLSLGVLGCGTLLVGFWGLPPFLDFWSIGNQFSLMLESVLPPKPPLAEHSFWVPLLSVLVAVLGWYLAKILYKRQLTKPAGLWSELLSNGFYIDDLYYDYLWKPLRLFSKEVLSNTLEQVFYRLPFSIAAIFWVSGQKIGKSLQRGLAADYLLAIVLWLVFTLIIMRLIIR